ncbi:MAG: FliA/WhiG family RNA polymerase sigma factor [Ktedonobacteraceae bacterium]|nr:FliA/WhiG family RNA polymerase sigma factor [Ktedonobacteraceae bacterium]MBV9614273.1 FliA/WhiG family RNA polymerase sigma factor [Ktedonobacteraceae bacterium]MBV9713493.1 FliA/WhiG family RNA polymerase sigma factor [Ktedonobacteraceae bacterium]
MSATGVRSDLWAEFIETREQKLREELITEYAPLVRFVVGRLGIPPTSLLEFDDLVSYGMIGLINAIDRFETGRDVPFEAFATPRIRGAVIDHLRSLNWQPRAAVSRVRQVEAALASVEQRMGRPAKEEEVAGELGVSVERYRQMLVDASTTVLSLDVPINSLQDDEMSPLKDLLEDEDAPGPAEAAERQELAIALSAAIDQLPERERLLLALYYQEELTMKEISKVLSVSESRVCQLHMQAIMRLRGVLHTHRTEDPPQVEKQTTKRAQQKAEAQEKQPASQAEETKEVVAGGKRKRLVS